jgi:phage terminase large subunit
MLKYPNSKGLIVRKVRDTLSSTALDTWRKFVIKEALISGEVIFYGGSAEEPPQYRYRNGSRVNIGGMDKPTKIMSSEYDMIYVQEAIELTVTDWENITTRLRNGNMPYQQLIADTNPGAPTHWLKMRCDAGEVKLLNSKHSDNPVLIDDNGLPTAKGIAYFRFLDALTGVRRSRLRDGQWVAAEGMIYEAEWDESKHVVDAFTPPWEWRRYWSVDFGYVHPFVLGFWAQDTEGCLWLYREIYHTKRLVVDHAAKALSVVNPGGGRQWSEPRPSKIICDHDSENRAQLDRALMAATSPAKKDVLAGIQLVQSRLALPNGIRLMRNVVVERDQDLKEAGKPTCTIEEIPGYVWDMSMGKTAREAPVKENDDGCDMMRYTIATIDRRFARAPVRFIQ